MDINLGSITWLSSGFAVAGSCKQRDQDLFPQHDEARHSSQALWGGFIVPGVLDPPDQVFAPKFLQIIGSLASMIIGDGIAKDLFNASCKVRRCESSWIDREADDPLHHGPHSRPIDIDTSNSGLPHLRGKRPCVQLPIINERNIHPSQNLQEPFQDTLEQCNHSRKPINPLPTAQLFRVVDDYLDSQDAFAFAIHLDRQLPIMDLEDRQIIDRSLDHDLDSGTLAVAPEKGAMFGAKEGLDRFEIQGSSGSINNPLKHLIQVLSTREEKVAAIFDLVDRIGVTESAFLLLLTLQSEAQAPVNPTLTDLDQAPYRARSSHGICDSGQACGVGNIRKAIPLFTKGDLFLLGLTGHVFMTVEDHLNIKRRMGTEFDGRMPPLRVQDVERIVIDVRDLGRDVPDLLLGAMDVENRHGCPSNDDTKDPSEGWIFRDVLFCDFMLLFLFLAFTVDQGNPLLLGVSMDSAAKATRKLHEMGVVKILVAPSQLAPPRSESPGTLSHNEIGIEHNAIDTIINPVKTRLILLAKLIGQLHRSFLHREISDRRIEEVIDEVNRLKNRAHVGVRRWVSSYPRGATRVEGFEPSPPEV